MKLTNFKQHFKYKLSAMFQIFPEKVKSSSTVPGVAARGHDDIIAIAIMMMSSCLLGYSQHTTDINLWVGGRIHTGMVMSKKYAADIHTLSVACVCYTLLIHVLNHTKYPYLWLTYCP